MLLEAQNRREMAHFIAACGRAYSGEAEAYQVKDNMGLGYIVCLSLIVAGFSVIMIPDSLIH